MNGRTVMPARHVTLALSTLLHALTHAYAAILVPLYLLVRADLHLVGVQRVALIVTIYGVVYFLLSYPAGILADHVNRRNLLGLGLIGNALAILLMGLTHQYWLLVLAGVLAGVSGSLFHPAANALVPAHYPQSAGMALGIMGIGSGVGFFLGSQYSGWRAQTVVHPWWGISSWQVPCVELALLGLVVSLVFLLLAREAEHGPLQRAKTPMGKGMRGRVLLIALILGCRDFAGAGSITLVSLYLQKAHGFDAQRTGWIIGAMGIISVFATPMSIWISRGRRRLPGLATAVIAGGLVLSTVPHVSITWMLAVLAIFQVFHLASYAMGEVALVELVSPAVRGRVIGLFLTVAGTFGACSPWVIGFWTDHLGASALHPQGYYVPFAAMGVMMIFAASAIRLMHRLGQAHPVEIAPPPAELVG